MPRLVALASVFALALALACAQDAQDAPPADAPLFAADNTPSRPETTTTAARGDVIEVDDATALEDPAPALRRSREPWTWLHTDVLTPRRALTARGAAPTYSAHVLGDPHQYTAWREGSLIKVRRETLAAILTTRVTGTAWTVTLGDDATGEPVVFIDPTTAEFYALAGYRRDDGYTVHALTRAGATRWLTRAPDPPDVAATELQLAYTRDAIVVLNRGSDGAYLDELDHETGRVIARARIDAGLIHEDAPWPPSGGLRSHALGSAWPGAEGDYRVLWNGEMHELHARDSDGAPRWSAPLGAPGERRGDHAVVLEHGAFVVVVVHTRRANWTRLYSFTRDDGAPRFHGPPGWLLGSIRLSGYRNEVAIARGPGARVIVYAREREGQYVGVVDLAQGELLGFECWR